jgi:hypothetical protein
MFGTPVHAAAYFIGGTWYYFSIDFQALIKKLTGKDLNDGTSVQTEQKIGAADTLCLNPQTFQLSPGKGPGSTALGSSTDITDADLTKGDRTKSTFTKTAVTDNLVPEYLRLSSICKNAPGASQWYQVYWQDRNCNKGADASAPVCYSQPTYAYLDPNTNKLTYLTGGEVVDNGTAQPGCIDPNTGSDLSCKYPSWTFIYLPTAFAAHAWLHNDTTLVNYADIYVSCQFSINNDPDAAFPGKPYSINNPPSGGWGSSLATYDCLSVTQDQYNQY